jgi:Tol biopolymer transport system component
MKPKMPRREALKCLTLAAAVPLLTSETRAVRSGVFSLGLILWLTAVFAASGLDQSTNSWQAAPGMKFSTHQYYDIPAWNCNGSLLLVVGFEQNESASKAYRVPYLVADIGTPNRRPAMPLRRVQQNRAVAYQWDVKDPDVLYFIGYKDATRTATLLHRLNIRTDQEDTLATADGQLQLAVPHPDGDHLLLIPKVGGTSDLLLFSMRDRKMTPIHVPAAVHRVRFTKSADLSVFCNTETESRADRLSYSLDINTGAKHLLVKGQAGHPDWNTDGTKLSFFMDGGLCVVNRSGERLQFFKDLSGHQSWSPDGRYIVLDGGRYTAPDKNGKPMEYNNYITMIEVASEKIIPLTPHHGKIEQSQDTHPHPNFSPDATKVVFNSNNHGQASPQAWVVKARNPDTVKSFTVAPEGGSFRLSWEPPAAKETKGFIIYRIIADDRSIPVVEAGLASRSYSDPGVPGVKGYGIAVKEYSGLQSETKQTFLR